MRLLAKFPFFTRKYVESLKLLYRSPTGYFQAFKHRKVLSRNLIVSFPRSGSSWVGAIVGSAENALYLREPVTTQYMLEKPHRISVFTPELCQDLPRYKQIVDKCLNGSASRANAIFKYPQQLFSNNVHLIVKEVNPLALPLFMDKPLKVIYLLRHPFAIAQSYQSLSWQQSDQFSKRFDQDSLAIIQQKEVGILNKDFWTQFGYLLGWTEAKTKQLLQEQVISIQYETLCQAPVEKFSELFEYLNLPFNEQNKAQIVRSVSGETSVDKGEFSLKRKLEDIESIKVNYADKANHDKLIRAYLRAGQHYNQVFNTSITLSYDDDSRFIQWIK